MIQININARAIFWLLFLAPALTFIFNVGGFQDYVIARLSGWDDAHKASYSRFLEQNRKRASDSFIERYVEEETRKMNRRMRNIYRGN